jgi:hypothetical protein
MEEQQRLSHYQELICAGHVSVLKKCGQKWQKSPTKTLIRF